MERVWAGGGGVTLSPVWSLPFLSGLQLCCPAGSCELSSFAPSHRFAMMLWHWSSRPWTEPSKTNRKDAQYSNYCDFEEQPELARCWIWLLRCMKMQCPVFRVCLFTEWHSEAKFTTYLTIIYKETHKKDFQNCLKNWHECGRFKRNG